MGEVKKKEEEEETEFAMDFDATTFSSTNGISVHALKHVFLQEIISGGFTKKATIHELDEIIIRKKGQRTVCPRDNKIGAAYVDCLIDNIGPANLFISYTWGNSVGDIVDSLVYYCEQKKLDQNKTYVWLCCLSNNQHRLIRDGKTIQIKPEIMQRGLNRIMTMCRNAVVLMSPWRKPILLSRIWCVNDIFIMTKLCSEVNVIMPPREIQTMFEYFQESIGHTDLLYQFFVDFANMVKNANSSVQADKEFIQRILKVHGDGKGYEEVNKTTNSIMRNYIKDTFSTKTNKWINDAEQRLVDEYSVSDLKLQGNNYESNDLMVKESRDEINNEINNEIGNLNGISVDYLKHRFLQEIKDSNMSVDSTIYEIENLDSQNHGIIRSKGRDVVCPHDGKIGAAYVDCLDGSINVGTANFMLSYSWGNTASDIVGSLDNFCSSNKLDPKRTYVWICCLCVNQHRVKGYVPVDVFHDIFCHQVKSIGHIICLMSPWNKPIYLTRLWCVFELFTACENSCIISIVMPPRDRRDIITKIGDTEALYCALIGGKVENATAKYSEDKKRIFDIVQQGSGGFDRLDKVVNEKFREWIKETVVNELNKWTTSVEIKFLEEYIY